MDFIKTEYIINEIKKSQKQLDAYKTKINYAIFVINDIDDIDIVNHRFDNIFLITPSKIFFINEDSFKKERISSYLHESAIKLANVNDVF